LDTPVAKDVRKAPSAQSSFFDMSILLTDPKQKTLALGDEVPLNPPDAMAGRFRTALGTGLAGLSLALSGDGAIKPPPRPNIVVILADDMGFSDVGCYGGEISTPNLDRLAAEGLRFTQFYNAARCCPTRAALLTGLYPHQAGVGAMIRNLGTPAYQGFLNDAGVTIAEVLREQGYRTFMSGKWHVGEERPHWPTDRGFDRYFGLISGASSYFKLDKGRKMALDDQPFTPPAEGFYLTDAITTHALQFLDEAKGKPFFLYLAYTAPHWPLHALPDDIAKYRGRYRLGWDELRRQRHTRQLKLGLVNKQWPLSPRDPAAPAWDSLRDAAKDAWDLRMAVYAAQIDRMDQGIGRVRAKLRQLGVEKNTLILFLSDNGGCHERVGATNPAAPPGGPDSFMAYGLPWANASNTPFRQFKSRVHEGGIATPLIAWWPALIKKGGRLTPQVGHVIDLMPTVLEAAGAEHPEKFHGRELTPLAGRSLLPVLRGQTRPVHDALFWEHFGNRAVRQGRWKLVALAQRDWELYDLEADRTELNNLAAIQPEKVTELAALYRQWAERCGVKP
jgi:arylsulfatase